MARLDHLSLAVGDWRRSRDWYVGCFGFRVEFEVPQGGAAGRGVAALQDDAGLTIFLDEVEGAVIGGQSSYTLKVDDVEALFERLSGEGVVFASPPSKQFWGYGAVLFDPDGHRLHLYDEASMQAKG